MRGAVLRGGPLRDTFLRSTAALLGVPERYPQMLAQLQVPIASVRNSMTYDETRFGDVNHLGLHEVARFMAATGITPAEAETWRPWATAFIEMELEACPKATHAPLLQQARQLTRERIDSDPTWALTGVHVDVPGNYNPRLERARAERAQQALATQLEAGPSSVAAGDNVQPLAAHPDDVEDYDELLDYGNEEEEEDILMGPA
jgi:hypothetical protein